MAINWHLPVATSSLFRVRVRGSANGPAVLTTPAGTYTQTVNTAVNDGNVLFEVGWATAGDTIPISVSVDGETETGEAQTLPETGNYSVAFGTCWDRRGHFAWADYLLQRSLKPCLFVWGGDLGYSEFALNANGINFPGVSAGGYSNFLTNARLCFRQTFQDARVRSLLTHVPTIFQLDDHDPWPGNNGPRTTLANLNSDGLTLTTQGEVDQIVAWGLQAADEYLLGQPYERGVDATARYFSFRIQDTLFIQLDTTTYRDQVEEAQSVNKYMLQALQEQWVYDTCDANPDVGFIVVLSPKECYRDTFNNDGWHQYRDQGDRIRDWMYTNTTACVIWATGDVHYPCITASTAQGVVEIKSSPLSRNTLNTGDGYDTNVVWRPHGYYGQDTQESNNIGLLDFSGDTCTGIIRFLTGREKRVVMRAGVKGIYAPGARVA